MKSPATASHATRIVRDRSCACPCTKSAVAFQGHPVHASRVMIARSRPWNPRARVNRSCGSAALRIRRKKAASRMRAIITREAWTGWPWKATADFVQGHAQLRSLTILVAWLAVAGLFSYWQFRRTVFFDAEAASARSSGRSAISRLGERAVERFFRFPSMLLGDPLGALVEKEVRFLTRSPRVRLVFLMGFTFGLLVWLPVALGRQEGSPSFLGTNYLTVVSVYSLLLLSEACFWNFFGFDRSAAQIYFLAPIPFARVMIGKNLSALFFIVLEIGMIALVCGLLGMPLRPRTLTE